MSIRDDLQGVPLESYGEDYAAHRLEMYSLYVEMTDRISERRQTANSFFLTMNSAIVALVGYVQLGGDDTGSEFYALVAIAGIVLSYLWYRLIRSYRGLNAGKFRVIEEIEALLPIRPYAAEWTALGKGEDPKKYLPFTHVESKVPWIFIAIHSFVLLRVILWALGVP